MTSLKDRVAQRRAANKAQGDAVGEMPVRDALEILNLAVVRIQRDSAAIQPPTPQELARRNIPRQPSAYGKAATVALQRKIDPARRRLAQLEAARPRFKLSDVLSLGAAYMTRRGSSRRAVQAVRGEIARLDQFYRPGGPTWRRACMLMAKRAEDRRQQVCSLVEMSEERRKVEHALASARGADFGDPISARSRRAVDVAEALVRHAPDLLRWRLLKAWIEALERLDSRNGITDAASGLSAAQRVCRRVRNASPPPSAYLEQLMETRHGPGSQIRPDVHAAMESIVAWRRQQVPENRILEAIAAITPQAPLPQVTSSMDAKALTARRAFSRHPSVASAPLMEETGTVFGGPKR